ncbi:MULTISPECIES: hypothetical protein [Chelativorans]|jgi:hypothetical protein|uniref:Uncharacterized protein n=1 Tax=Chelativorans sp. (strain BNC1) TaxID=266779 RepID=Q11EM7_CHESB|nr:MULTISPECIES: hypothetical protein [Chelativorans]
MSERKPRTDPPTTDRLRADIDEGRTNDKVRYPDPAAAPLGTDDEASGAPPSAEQRRMEHENRRPGDPPRRREPGSLLIYVLLIAGIALIITGTFALLQS